MPTVHLDDRALISVEGDDAETFLQNIITTDLSLLVEGEARPSALASSLPRVVLPLPMYPTMATDVSKLQRLFPVFATRSV